MSLHLQHARSHTTRIARTFVLVLLVTLSSSYFASAAAQPAPALIRLSTDPYTNSSSQHRTEVEPDTYSFGSTIVAAFQAGRFYDSSSSNIGWATSNNAGKTWTHGFLPGTTVFAGGSYDRVSDPSVAYDAAHRVWLISSLAIVGTSPNLTSPAILVSRSTDNGLTWGNPITVVKGGSTFYDKEWIACDDTSRSPFYGHCYVQWDDVDQQGLVLMSTSTDGGKTWGKPNSPANAHTFFGEGGQPVVQPNGTVIVPFFGTSFASGVTSIMAFLSTNGGKSWNSAVTVASLNEFVEQASYRGGALPSAAIDEAGQVYVVWSDCRFEPNCSTNDLVMSTSSDGTTWSAVQRIPINPFGSGFDYRTPGLAVDTSTAGSKAHLALAFYYFTSANCFTYNCQLNVGFASSINGGASWSAQEHLAGPMQLSWLADTSSGFMVGDYISTSIVGNDAFPVFAVATPPTGGLLDEAMYTAADTDLPLVGGTMTSQGEQAVAARHVHLVPPAP